MSRKSQYLRRRELLVAYLARMAYVAVVSVADVVNRRPLMAAIPDFLCLVGHVSQCS